MTDRLPGSPGKYSAVVAGGELQKMQTGKPFAITLRLDDEPVREGTPYSKAAVLPDHLAAQLCPETEDPAPKDAFRGLWEKKADGIRRKSGTVISVEDSAHTPLKGLRLFGKTMQDGTPTPTAPVELETAGASGNIGVTVGDYNTSKMIAGITHAEGNYSYTDARITTEDFIRVFEGSYVLECEGLTKCCVIVFDLDGNVITAEGYADNWYDLPCEFDIKGDRKIKLSFQATASNVDAYKPVVYKKDEPVQTLTASTPNGLPGIPVSSGGNYTDENGQAWICDEIDFARGVYVQRVLLAVFDGSGDEKWGTWNTKGGNKRMGTNDYNKLVKGTSVSSQKANGLCSRFAFVSAGSNGTWGENIGVSVEESGLICFYDSAHNTTVADWTAFLASNPVTCLFQRITPIETALSAEELEAYALLHTNTPNTTILNDAGADMEVAYYTPTTPVQMVHSPADAGKILSIDECGCVAMVEQKDRIVEQGISGNWTYRKWDSGIAECWMKYAATADGSNTFGGSPVWDKFYQCHTADIPLPVVFTQMPTFYVSTSGGAPVIYSGTTYVSNSVVNMIQLNSYVRTEDISKSYTITYCVHAVGKWK